LQSTVHHNFFGTPTEPGVEVSFLKGLGLSMPNPPLDLNDRYEYGELRLARLNQIYRMKGLGLAYFNVHRDYSSYFGKNYATLIALFALVSVALSAIQVITNIDGVSTGMTIGSYRFTIGTLAYLA
jgi:hypothetical protein